ncbi:MAG: PilZ domain-containing protein, partial [Spirochaetaceae bacterium]|nr:PilZ domain-containing protein [Spirochaetaceae bacterium]
MIILILAEDKSLKKRFSSFFGKLGYSIIQYTHPLKTMDNLDEISPDILICNATDYPRHWKLIVKQIRDNSERNETAVILSIEDEFDPEEA